MSDGDWTDTGLQAALEGLYVAVVAEDGLRGQSGRESLEFEFDD